MKNAAPRPGHEMQVQRPHKDEPRHQFYMRGVAELVDRGDAIEGIAACDQDARIAHECRHIARYRNDDGYLAGGQLVRLRLRALPRRIEHHGVIVAQFRRHQRPPEQVARLGLDRLQAGGRCRCLLQRRHRAGIAVECRDARPRRKPQRERPDPAKQIGDVFCPLAMVGHQPCQRFFAGHGGLQERSRR